MFAMVHLASDWRPMERPPAPAEAVLIRLAREAAGIRVSDAAERAGISVARWSQIESGSETRAGRVNPVRAKPGTIARMAREVGLTPERLAGEGKRPDAAAILGEIIREGQEGRGSVLRPDPAWRPEPVPGGHFSVLDVTAAEPFAAVLREQHDELRASGVADPDGAAMFPAHDTVPAAAGFAAAWDAAMMYAPGPDEESRVTQVIWMTALYQARREARQHEQGNADSALNKRTIITNAGSSTGFLPAAEAVKFYMFPGGSRYVGYNYIGTR
jgi:transcriptional regulator with XRE-family HTH domain